MPVSFDDLLDDGKQGKPAKQKAGLDFGDIVGESSSGESFGVLKSDAAQPWQVPVAQRYPSERKSRQMAADASAGRKLRPVRGGRPMASEGPSMAVGPNEYAVPGDNLLSRVINGIVPAEQRRDLYNSGNRGINRLSEAPTTLDAFVSSSLARSDNPLIRAYAPIFDATTEPLIAALNDRPMSFTLDPEQVKKNAYMEQFASSQRTAEANKPFPVNPRFSALLEENKNSLLGTLGALAMNPIDTATNTADSVIQFSPALAAAVLSRGKTLPIGASGVNSFMLEQDIGQYFAQKGIDITTPEGEAAAIQEIQTNPANIDRFLDSRMIVTATDMATAGLIPAPGLGQAFTRSVPRTAARVAAGVGTDSVASGAAEFEAQRYNDPNNISNADVALEMIAGPMSPLAVGTAVNAVQDYVASGNPSNFDSGTLRQAINDPATSQANRLAAALELMNRGETVDSGGQIANSDAATLVDMLRPTPSATEEAVPQTDAEAATLLGQQVARQAEEAALADTVAQVAAQTTQKPVQANPEPVVQDEFDTRLGDVARQIDERIANLERQAAEIKQAQTPVAQGLGDIVGVPMDDQTDILSRFSDILNASPESLLGALERNPNILETALQPAPAADLSPVAGAPVAGQPIAPVRNSADTRLYGTGIDRGEQGEVTNESVRLEQTLQGWVDTRAASGNPERGANGQPIRVQDIKITELPRRALFDTLAGALEAAERTLVGPGRRIAVITDEGSAAPLWFDGVYQGNTLYLNATADKPLVTVASHEFVHGLKESDPDLYARLEAYVEQYGDETGHSASFGYNREPGYTRAKGVEELTANLVGEAMSDRAFLEGLAKREPNLFRDLAERFIEYLDDLLAVFGRQKDPGVNKYVKDVQAFRNLLEDVLVEKAQRNEAKGDVLALADEIGWAQEGGQLIARNGMDAGVNGEGGGLQVQGRTSWKPKARADGMGLSNFWPMRPGDNPGDGAKISERAARLALKKYANGEKMTAQERRFIAYAEKTAAEYKAEREQDSSFDIGELREDNEADYGNTSPLFSRKPANSGVQEAPQTGRGAQLDLFLHAEKQGQVNKARLFQTSRLTKTGEFRSGVSRVNSLDDAAHILAPLRKSPQEQFLILALDESKAPIAVIRHTIGLTSQSQVDPGIVFGAIAAIDGVKSVVFGHNHPSGRLISSDADKMVDAAMLGLMRGSGIDHIGSIIVAPGKTQYAAYAINKSDSIGDVKPARRSGAVPMVERQFVRIAPSSSEVVSSPIAAKRIALDAIERDGAGAILLDSQNRTVGYLPIDAKSAEKLRTGDIRTSFAPMIRDAVTANASGVIMYGNKADEDGLFNVGRAFAASNIRPLDAIMRDADGTAKSSAEQGKDFTGTFFSRRPEQPALIPEPTARERVQAAEADKTARRNGNPQSRTDMMAGDGELFAGERPTQEPMFSRKNWYRSELAANIGDLSRIAAKDGSASTDQVKSWVAKRIQEGKFKKAEVESIGLNEYLSTQDDRVRVEDVQAFVEQNGVQVTETALGEQGSTGDVQAAFAREGYGLEFDPLDPESAVFTDPDGDEVEFDDLPESLQQAIEQNTTADGDRPDDDTKYGKYQLPGGQNYRELLLTLPEPRIAREQQAAEVNNQVIAYIEENGPTDKMSPEKYDEYKRLEAKYYALVDAPVEPAYRSSHWDQPNILAHVRFNERTDADGKRVLFIEELQSDWAQDGRKRGFDSPAKKARRNELRDKWIANTITEQEGVELDALEGEISRVGIPVQAAPFVTDTNAWVQLALKRMVAYAVENGFDKVAFVNGEQSADRYDLSKQVDRIDYYTRPDGMFDIEVLRSGQRTEDAEHIGGPFTPEKLEQTVGKEIAQKIVDDKGKRLPSGWRRIDGLDLKVGGEGMKSFYDRIVPQNVRAVLKKLGGGELGKVSIDIQGSPETGTGLSVEREWRGPELTADSVRAASRNESLPSAVQGQLRDIAIALNAGEDVQRAVTWFGSDAAAKALGGELVAKPNKYVAQPGFAITPAMREAVDAGLPLFSRRIPGFDNGQWVGLKQAASEARETFQDRMISWAEVQGRIEQDTGSPIEDAANVYRLENLMHGKVSATIRDLENTFFIPISKEIGRLKLTTDDVQHYLIARHAQERNEAIARRNPAMPDGGSGLNTAEANAYLDGLDAEKRRKLESVARRIDALISDTRRRMLAGGLITREQFDALNTYQHYVPLRGKEGKEQYGFGSKGADTRGKLIRNALGRGNGNGAMNVLGEVIGDSIKSVIMAERAKVGRAAIRLALANPSSLWEVNPIQTERYLNAAGEVAERILSPMNDQEVVIVKVGGQNMALKIKDRRLLESLKALDHHQLADGLKAFATINRYFSAVLTQYNPAFVPVNATRDAIFGLSGLSAEHGAYVASKAATAYKSAARAAYRHARGKPALGKWGEYAVEFANAGGQTGYVNMDTVEELQRKIGSGSLGSYNPAGVARAVRWVGDFVGDVNQAVENALRLSAYGTLRETGMSPDKAAEYAKNLTVNFNRKGRMGANINAIILFYNAAMQGAVRAGTLIKNPKVLAGLGALGTVQALLALYAMGIDGEDDEPLWNKIPDHVKRRNLVIPMSEDRIYTIPMPYGFNVFPYMAGRMVDALAQEEDRPQDSATRLTGDFASALLESFFPVPLDEGAMGVIPQAIKPLLEIQRNKDGLGRSIRNEPPFPEFDAPLSNIGKPDTPEAYKTAAKALNRIGGGDDYTKPLMGFDWAPEDLEYLLKAYTGGAGQFVLDSARLGEKAAGDLDITPKDIPIIKRYVTNIDPAASQSALYYDRRESIERKDAQLRDILKADGEAAARAFFEATPELQGARMTVKGDSITLKVDDPESVFGKYKAAKKAVDAHRDTVRQLYSETPPSIVPTRETAARDRAIRESELERAKVQAEFNRVWQRDVVGRSE